MAIDKITTPAVTDDSVTLAKLSATGTKNSTTFLRGDNTFAAAGGGLVLISNTTISSTGALDINGIFSSTYQNYRVIGSNLKCGTDNSDWTFQLRTSSAVQGNAYYWSGVGQRGAGNAVDDGDTNGGNFKILRNTANDTASTNFDMTLFQPNVANVSKNYSCVAGGRRQDDTAQVLTCSGFLASDTVFTGLRFLANQGNITAGNILVFGIKDS